MIKRILSFVLITFCYSAIAQNNLNKEKAYQLTLQIRTALENKWYDSIASHFDSTMSRQFDAEKLESAWESLPNTFGDFGAFQNTTIDTVAGVIVSQTILPFKKANLCMRISFNQKMKIVGLYFLPQYNYTPADYVNTLSFVEYKIDLGKTPYIVHAVLTLPNRVKNPPCVVIVGGSGPTDKDMTYGTNKPYKDIAWGLAAKGIAVLRYDKRTANYGQQLLTDKYAGKQLTIKEEYLDDVKDVITYLKTNEKINAQKIFILGHSQGGMLAPLICEQNNGIAGIIMMAANARPIQDLAIEQLNYLYKDGTEAKAEAMKRQFMNAKNPKLKADFPQDSLPGTTADYWISLNKYNQVKTAKKIKQPMLFLQGERDYQVTMKDLTIWKENLSKKNNCIYKSYPKLNHHFIEGTGAPSREDYEKRGNVPEYIIDDIVAWINSIN